MEENRKCKKCNNLYLLNITYFSYTKPGNGKFAGSCRKCIYSKQKEWILQSGKNGSFYYKLNNPPKINQERDSNLWEKCALLLKGVKARSSKNNLEYDKEYFTKDNLYKLLTLNNKCECCKKDFDFLNKKNPSSRSVTIDKINPIGNYTKNNVAFICYRCNFIKNNGFLNEFEMIVKWMKNEMQLLQS